MPVEIESLRKISYFGTLSTDDLTQVAMFTVERHFNRGDLILIAGETEGSLCYVCSGLVKVFKTSPEGKEQVLRLIGAGNTFNDVPALDGGPNPANVAAVESSKIYVIKRSGLHKLIMTRPEVAEAVVGKNATPSRHFSRRSFPASRHCSCGKNPTRSRDFRTARPTSPSIDTNRNGSPGRQHT
jgi:CRP-like cAMP-binding protein